MHHGCARTEHEGIGVNFTCGHLTSHATGSDSAIRTKPKTRPDLLIAMYRSDVSNR